MNKAKLVINVPLYRSSYSGFDQKGDEKMKKNFINLVAISCLSISLSGCFGSLPTRPTPSVQPSKEGVTAKVDEGGHITLVTKNGLVYQPCGEEYQIKCPAISENAKETLIGTISEVSLASKPKTDSAEPMVLRANASTRSNSSCDPALKIKIGNREQLFVIPGC